MFKSVFSKRNEKKTSEKKNAKGKQTQRKER